MKHNCLKCGIKIDCRSNFCSEKCRRNWRYHNIIGVKENDALYSREYRKKWIKENDERLKGCQVEWRKNNPDKILEYKEKWNGNNKEARRAHRIDYKLRGDRCEQCESIKNLEFHHTDYNLHLGKTLCRACHSKLHKLQRRCEQNVCNKN